MPGLLPWARRAALILLLFVGTAAAQAAEMRAAYRAALDSISAGDLKQYVSYLADPRFEGREAGTRGGQAAGQYVRRYLSALHLRPAGDKGDYFQPFAPNYRNVVAMLEGSDPKLKDEYLAICAHYDHVGYATSGGSRLGEVGRIHPGADDNASGTAGLLALAQAFTLLPEPPRRSILFISFDAEEKGILGSKHFAAHPTVPLDRVVLAVNMDMIGRLRNDRLEVFGTRSALGLRRLLSLHNSDDPPMILDFSWNVVPNADHYPFFSAGIPVLVFHTDLHDDYHRPLDTADKINAAGMARVLRLVFASLVDLAGWDQVPPLRRAATMENEDLRRSLDQQAVVLPGRLGVNWDNQPTTGRGVRVNRVAAGSPAERAGLRPGDRILRIAGRPTRSDDEMQAAVMAAPTRAPTVLERPELAKPAEVTVELKGNPMRVGITWRVDDAEPGTVIVTQVVPGSPAAQAGVERGDHIYQIDGQDFADETQLNARFNRARGSIRLQLERNGQVRSVELHLDDVPVQRAA